MTGKKFKNVLIDLSGTLHIENEITPNAIKSLERLRNKKLNIKFVTNTTKESRNVLYNRLKNLGFNIEKKEIFTSLIAAREFVINKSLNPYYLVDDKAMEDFEGISSSGKYNAVVVGLAPDKFNKETLDKAFRLLLDNHEAPIIAIHKGKYYREKNDLSLGPGPFVKLLEYATNKEAHVVGKPNKDFFLSALDGELPEETCMIGDDVIDDIAGAQIIGIKGYLVKTGKYRVNDENRINPPPYKVVVNFAEAVKDILEE